MWPTKAASTTKKQLPVPSGKIRRFLVELVRARGTDIVVASRSVQDAGQNGLRSAGTRATGDDFAPIRIKFDFTHVDTNGQSSEQQAYVKGLIEKSGEWLRYAKHSIMYLPWQ